MINNLLTLAKQLKACGENNYSNQIYILAAALKNEELRNFDQGKIMEDYISTAADDFQFDTLSTSFTGVKNKIEKATLIAKNIHHPVQFQLDALYLSLNNIFELMNDVSLSFDKITSWIENRYDRS